MDRHGSTERLNGAGIAAGVRIRPGYYETIIRHLNTGTRVTGGTGGRQGSAAGMSAGGSSGFFGA